MRIDRWLPEILCRHEYEIRAADNGHWVTEIFNPDAFVRLTRQQPPSDLNFFIEVDLGHTSSRQFLAKLVLHQRYLDSGLFRSVYECDEFRTLVITTTDARLRNLLSLVEEKRSDLFWFTTFAAIKERGVLEPIWRVPLRDGLVALVQ